MLLCVSTLIAQSRVAEESLMVTGGATPSRSDSAQSLDVPILSRGEEGWREIAGLGQVPVYPCVPGTPTCVSFSGVQGTQWEAAASRQKDPSSKRL